MIGRLETIAKEEKIQITPEVRRKETSQQAARSRFMQFIDAASICLFLLMPTLLPFCFVLFLSAFPLLLKSVVVICVRVSLSYRVV